MAKPLANNRNNRMKSMGLKTVLSFGFNSLLHLQHTLILYLQLKSSSSIFSIEGKSFI